MRRIYVKARLIVLICTVCFSLTALAEAQGFRLPQRAIFHPQMIVPYKTINQSIDFTDKKIDKPIMNGKTIFKQEVSYINSKFLNVVNLNLAIFMKSVRMQGVSFAKNFDTSWALFHTPVSLYDVTFNKTMTFFNCVFANSVNFYHLIAKDLAIFQGTRFNDKTLFSHSRFLGGTYFYNALFKEKVIFKDVEFLQEVDFSFANFKQDVVFDTIKFFGKTKFASAQFGGHVTFKKSSFSGYLDFSHVIHSKYIIDLTRVEHKDRNERIKLNLVGANIDKFNLHYSDFKLFFPKGVTYSEKIGVYKELLNNFQKKNYVTSYNLLYPEYREFLYASKDNWFANYMQKNWWNYGINKEWVFVWIAWFLLFFTVINSFFFESLVKNHCSVPFLEKTTYDFSIKKNPLIRYVYYFPRALILTIILFFGGSIRLGVRISNFKGNNLLVNIYLMIMLITGFICMFFMFKYLIG